MFRRQAVTIARTARGAGVRSFSTSVKSSRSVAPFALAGGLLVGYQFLPSQDEVSHAAVAHYGKPGTRFERTFIAVKPDGVQRGIVGDIIGRFEAKGYKLVAMKMIHPTRDFAEKHYKDLSKKPFFPGLVNYFSSGPVVAMVWEGKDVIKGGRTLLGATNPSDSLPGTIRGDLCIDVGRNICHGSDGPDSAQDEISLWFNPHEVSDYENSSAKWIYEKVCV